MSIVSSYSRVIIRASQVNLFIAFHAVNAPGLSSHAQVPKLYQFEFCIRELEQRHIFLLLLKKAALQKRLVLRAGVHKNQTLSGKLQNFKIAQTLAVSSP